jgi:membrane complex biogenesis BtpA family protein
VKKFASLFGGAKPILAMVHLKALPGSPRGGELDAALAAAQTEARALVAAGADGIIVENFGDVPFAKERVSPATVAAMAVICRELRREHDVPLGVNVLRNDAEAAVAIAAVVGADFFRVNVHVGAAVTDQGLIEGRARETILLRKALGSAALLFADVAVKHSQPLERDEGVESLVLAAQETRFRGLADALILTGRATGSPPAAADVQRVRDAVSDTPLLVGSGVNEGNLAVFWPLVDGMIVGSFLKVAGDAGAPVDPERARMLFSAAAALPKRGS